MKVLIDGHNAMGALNVAGPSHEAKRHALLRRVALRSPEAIVFFDARGATGSGVEPSSESGVRVVYCRDREADAFILDAVRDARSPEGMVVVTNDREVAGRARQLGAQSQGVQEFFGAGEAPPDAPPGERPRSVRHRFTPRDFGLPDLVDLDDPEID